LEFQVADFNFQGSHRQGYIKDGLIKLIELIELIASVELWRGEGKQLRPHGPRLKAFNLILMMRLAQSALERGAIVNLNPKSNGSDFRIPLSDLKKMVVHPPSILAGILNHPVDRDQSTTQTASLIAASFRT
jgi:hypothetical protein